MRTVVKAYKFKLYKSKKNRHLDRGINIAASVWNYCIAIHRRYYRLYGKHLSAKKLKIHITKVKKTLHPEWQALGSQAIQDVVERVDRSGMKHSKTPWMLKDNIASWTWEGYEGKSAMVDVYSCLLYTSPSPRDTR